LFTKLDEPINEKRFDEGRGANIYVPGVSSPFNHLRDVYRFMGTIHFDLQRLRGLGTAGGTL